MGLSHSKSAIELNRRWEEAKRIFTPAAIANGHAKQEEILRLALNGQLRDMLLMCSRRAGKSRLVCGLLAIVAMRTDNCASLYLALTAGQARIIWSKHFIPMIRKFKIPCQYPRGQTGEMKAIFANGSTVVFGGTDDLRTVTHLLGDSMAAGLCVLDEQQDDPGILEHCATVIFGPMLNETTTEHKIPGVMVISGTVPDVEAGYFIKLWKENYDDVRDESKEDAAYLAYSWSRFDNPHETNNEYHLAQYLRKSKLKADDPKVLRAWYGLRTWGKFETCFRLSKSKNSYKARENPFPLAKFPTFVSAMAARPKPELDNFWIGVHTAQGNHRFSITGFGTSSKIDSGIWHLFEAVTAEEGDPTESEWIGILKWFKEEYGRISAAVRDPSVNNETSDLLLRSHGMRIEHAAKGPGSVKGRADRIADLLQTENLHILAGSELEKDLDAARWDPKEKSRKKWVFALSAKHPTVAESASYVIPYWTAVKEKPNPLAGMTESQAAAYQAAEEFRKRYQQSPRAVPRPRFGRDLFRRN